MTLKLLDNDFSKNTGAGTGLPGSSSGTITAGTRACSGLGHASVAANGSLAMPPYVIDGANLVLAIPMGAGATDSGFHVHHSSTRRILIPHSRLE